MEDEHQNSLSDEVTANLAQIQDEQLRVSIADQLSTLALVDRTRITSPLVALQEYEGLEDEASPYAPSEVTDGYVAGISMRVATAASELGDQTEVAASSVWDRVLASQMVDIGLTKESGDQDKVQSLIIEHMVTINLASAGDGYSSESRQELILRERAKLSMLKLTQMGLDGSAIDASRRAQGMVLATKSKNGYSEIGEPPATHTIQSVAHTFESSLKALEVGVGIKISLDPAELAVTDKTVDRSDIEELDTIGSAIAATARVNKANELGPVPEDEQIIEELNHQGIRSLASRSNIDVRPGEKAASDTIGLITLRDITPSLSTSSDYAPDFTTLRCRRLVDSNYRVNDSEVNRLDADVLLLLDSGNPDLVRCLLTANQAELIDPRDPDRAGVFNHVFNAILHDQFSPEQQLRMVADLKTLQLEKITLLHDDLETLLDRMTVGEDVKRQLKYTVTNGHDPESVLHGVGAIQNAAPETVDPEIMDKVIKQLLNPTGWNDSVVLDELGAGADKIAPLFFDQHFQELISDRRFGRDVRDAVLSHYEESEKILATCDQLMSDPQIQKVLAEYSSPKFISDIIRNPDMADEYVAKMAQINRFDSDIFSASDIVELFTYDNRIEFIKRLSDSDVQVPFFNGLDKDSQRVILDVGLHYANSPTEKDNLIANARLINSAKPLLDLISQADLLPEASSMIKRSLLLSEDLIARSEDLQRALNETNLLELIGHDGSAYSFGNTILGIVLASDDPFETTNLVCRQFLSNDPLWLRCYRISQIGVGNIEDIGYQKGLNIREIPMTLPVPSLSHQEQMQVIVAEPPKRFADLSVAEKRLVARLDDLSDDQVESLGFIAFDQLAPEYQRNLLAYRLFETVALSRDPESQQRASQRNIQRAHDKEWLRGGDLVHSTDSLVSLRAIITSGAMAGETLGFRGRADGYPYNLDTVEVSSSVTQKPDYPSQLDQLQNGGFGAISLVFGRGYDALHQGEEFPGHMTADHRLILGGLPSTEIAAILLRGPRTEEIAGSVKRMIVESGIYIPVVSPDGSLLLTPEEFNQLGLDNNIKAVRPEVVDGAFERVNSQQGSNEGSEFIVPGETGQPPERWYVKFGEDNPDRLWTELLSDRIYGTVIPEVVPETRIVIVEGRLARASKIVTLDGGAVSMSARSEAFVIDCLIGNWDAVYNQANIVMSGGHGMRIDNGNGLDFRAQGDKKPEGAFSDTVGELETGSGNADLGSGMRQMYPELSDEEISQQVARMTDRLTDSTIDQLVDGIRRPESDRTNLKRTLKARRDYIVNYFSKQLTNA